MTATFYINKSAYNVLNKDLSEIGTTNLTLYEMTDLMQPKFKVKNKTTANYMYVQGFGYYFINNQILGNQCCYLICEKDVLMSFKNEILNNTYLIKRNEFLKDNRIVDNEIPISCKKQIVTQAISDDFISQSIQCFILGVI